MRPIFYEVPEGPLPKRDVPFLTGLALYMVFYQDGVEVKVNENYEGRTDFEIEPGLYDVTRRFLQNFAESNCLAAHQILKVNARSARGAKPKGRFDVVTRDEQHQTVVEEQRPNRKQPKPRPAAKTQKADPKLDEDGQMKGQTSIEIIEDGDGPLT